MDSIKITITPCHQIIPREKLYGHYLNVSHLLTLIINKLRKPGEKRLAAGTQLQYGQRMFAILKEIEKISLYETQQGRALIRFLRVQAKAETSKAPVIPMPVIKKMMKDAAEDKRQYELMLIAFMTAARIGSFSFLVNRGKTTAGWRFTWTYHKTFHIVGPKDVVIPLKCIPEEILPLMETLPLGHVCSMEEEEALYTTFQALFHGRTYCARRSALQYFRYDLDMSLQEIIPISLHSTTKTLEAYLTSQKEWEELELLEI